MLENVGYAETIAEQPSRIINSPGFQTALKEIGLKEALKAQGIDSKKIAEKVEVLLNAKDKEGNPEFNAIDKGLKHATNIYGIEDLDKPKGNTTYNFILNQQFKEKIRPLEEAYKDQFKNAKPPETI